MKMPETETVMMKCICNSCKSFEKCMSTGTMRNMKAFCSTGDAMEAMKKECTDVKQKNMDMKDTCMDKDTEDCMSNEDCMCQECPVAEEYKLTDTMYCNGSTDM